MDRKGRLTAGSRRALEALRGGGPMTPGTLARVLWPTSDLHYTAKTASGILSRLRGAGGLVQRTAPMAYEYQITRAGHRVLIQDEMLAGEVVLRDGRPLHIHRDAVPPCQVATVAAEHEPLLRHRLQVAREVLVLELGPLQARLPALLEAWLDEVCR